MKKIKWLSLFILLFFTFQGCDVSKQVSGAYRMTQCNYDYNSITNLSFAGINLSNGVSISTAPRVLAALTGDRSSLPLDFTINLNVTNPNESEAILNGLAYILKIDNVEFTRGAINQSLHINSGNTQILPLSIEMNLETLFSGNSKNAMENIVKNFIGVGDNKSNVLLQIKPSFKVGKHVVAAPQYIPVSFSFGGK